MRPFSKKNQTNKENPQNPTKKEGGAGGREKGGQANGLHILRQSNRLSH